MWVRESWSNVDQPCNKTSQKIVLGAFLDSNGNKTFLADDDDATPAAQADEKTAKEDGSYTTIKAYWQQYR